MRLSRLELFFCAVTLAACGRPTLDDIDGDDAGAGTAGERDAGTVAPLPDAGETLPERDAGGTTGPAVGKDGGEPPSPGNDAGSSCPDADNDGVCDAADNCVDVANAKQEDIDMDGVGDACAVVPVDCDADMLSNGTSLGSSMISSVAIDGNQQTFARVKPGASVNITVRLSVDNCGPFALPSMRLGIEGENDQCRTSLCTSETSFFSIPFLFTLTAPQRTGLHRVVAGLSSSGAACAGATSDVKTPIAALCVSP